MNSSLASAPSGAFSPRLRSTSCRLEGFTLVELLAAMAVFVLMMVMIILIVGSATNLWVAGKGRADNYARARVSMDLLQRELQGMVLRPDLMPLQTFADPVVPNAAPGGILCFTERTGTLGAATSLAPAARGVSLVRYSVSTTSSNTGLQRGDLGFSYNSTTAERLPFISPVSATPGPTPWPVPDATPDPSLDQPIGPGVLRMGIQFMDRTGALVSTFRHDFSDPSSSTNTAAVVISMLVVNEDALKLLNSLDLMPALLGFFTSDASSLLTDQTFEQSWSIKMASPEFVTTIPQEPIRRGIRVFQRYVLLPVPRQ